jgi:FkbM family methyltransferase
MHRLKFLAREVGNVRRILVPRDFRRWCGALWRGRAEIWRRRSLGPADDRLGERFSIRVRGRELQLEGASFGVVREIFGRECYIAGAELANCRTVVDLGANAGTFSLFAAVNAPECRVHAVEAQPAFVPIIEANLARNGLAGRVQVENALVGGVHDAWSRELVRRHPEIGTYPIGARLEALGTCDFLKCDVEGAEFRLLAEDRSWLRRVRRIALEYHGTWDDGAGLAEILRGEGLTVAQAAHGSLGYLFGSRP